MGSVSHFIFIFIATPPSQIKELSLASRFRILLLQFYHRLFCHYPHIFVSIVEAY